MPSVQKQRKCDQFRELLSEYPHFFILKNFQVGVADLTKFRSQLREKGAIYKVIKNRVFKFALEDSKFEDLKEHLYEPVGIVFAHDYVGVAKVVKQFIKDNQGVCVKAGFVDNQVVDHVYVNMLSDLMTREELISKLLWLMKFPIQRMALVLDKISQNKNV